MQRFEILVGLPSSLSCSILRDWLNLKSVIAVDSAFCCKSQRETFLDLLCSDEYFIREMVTISGKSKILKVLHTFGKKVRSATFANRLDPVQARAVVTNCTNLKLIQLNIRECCTPELMAVLKSNSSLESLSISLGYTNNPLNRVSLKHVVLPKLSTLVIDGYQETDEGILDVIKNARNVSRLDLAHSRISQSVLLQISQLCPNRTAFGLSSVLSLTDNTLYQITILCPHIVHLDIVDNSLLTGEGILAVAQKLELRSLHMGNCSQLTDASLVHLYTHCASSLHTLAIESLDGVPYFTSDVVNDLLLHCTQLRTFYFADEWEDSDYEDADAHITLVFNAASVQHLTTLILSGHVVKEQNIVTISKSGNQLEVLSLSKCFRYSQNSMKSLFTGCPRLTKLFICLEEEMSYDEELGVPNTFALCEFALELWMQLRPGLVIEQSVDHLPVYSVIDM